MDEIIHEFLQALTEEITALRQGGPGACVNVYDGRLVRREGVFYVYVFTTKNPLVVMDDAPARVMIHGQEFSGQIISVQGSEWVVGIEHDSGETIAEASLIMEFWFLLEKLRQRYQEVAGNQRTLNAHLAKQLFNLIDVTSSNFEGELNLPPACWAPNEEQLNSIRAACGSDIHFIWGPPGTGKTRTIGFLIAALMRLNLRVLVVAHTNVATDNAIAVAAELLQATEDYQSGKLVRFGNIAPSSNLKGNFEMVVPEKIAERLGQHLSEQIAEHQSKIQKMQVELTCLRKAEELLGQELKAQARILELESSLRRLLVDSQNLKARENSIAIQLMETEAKLAEAKAAGKLKRFFFSIDPLKFEAEISGLKRDQTNVRNTLSANLAKQDQIRTAVERTKAEAECFAKEAKSNASDYGLKIENYSLRINELVQQADKLATAIRDLEAKQKALQEEILSKARVIATSLTKATTDSKIYNQKFDVLVVDEASMAPLPGLFLRRVTRVKRSLPSATSANWHQFAAAKPEWLRNGSQETSLIKLVFSKQ